MSPSEVRFERRGRLGVVILNRPGAINAITHGMVKSMRERLGAWAADGEIAAVLLRGSGSRGLCVGGDVVALRRNILEGDGDAVHAFWRDEYALDHAISLYPKPFVSFMDGIVLGGGMGVSAHSSHRIVTERSQLGFPETKIGFVPDVGASWLLSRAPGELGTFLALTGASVGPGDAVALGFADHFVPSDRLTALARDLEDGDADEAIGRHSAPVPDAALVAERSWIDEVFTGAIVTDILQRLRTSTARAADAVADQILSGSPLSVAAALESLRRARALPDLWAALEQELTMSAHALFGHDFAEGIRAQLIDKDRRPAWLPATAADVTGEQVRAYFEPNVRLFR